MTAIPAAAADKSPGRIGRQIPLHFVVIFLMVVWLIPTIGLLVNSFRPPDAVTSSGWWTAIFSPSQFTLDNYAHVLAQSNMSAGFVNSLFISIPATVIPIMVAAFAAYAFAWMKFPGRDILFVVVVGLLVVPLQSTFIPILQLYGPKASTSPGPSWQSGWLTRATACRSRSTCCATSWASCRARSSSRQRSTVPAR